MSKIEEALEKAKKMREEMELEKEAPLPQAPLSPQYTQTKVIQTDPHKLQEKRIIAANRTEQAYEYYRFLRTQILHRTQEKMWNNILITSVLPGEGKTLTTINLAITFAKEITKTVLLVETDLRNPSIAKLFELPGEKGLSDYLLKDKVPLSELLVSPGIEKLVVLPAGQPVANVTEVLGSPKMQGLIKELKNRYTDRYIFFDSTPLLSSADALVLSPCVDAILLVVEAYKTTIDQVKRALDLLEEKPLLGIILNKAPIPERPGYSYLE